MRGNCAAVFCLALRAFSDMFDGESGSQKKMNWMMKSCLASSLDSLCDVVAFEQFPIPLLPYGCQRTDRISAIMFTVSVALSAWLILNVLETNHFSRIEEEHEKVYYGLPITSVAIILPDHFRGYI